MDWRDLFMDKKKQGFETICVQGGYQAKKGEPQVMPIVQNTTYRYFNTKDVAELFDLEHPDLFSNTPHHKDRTCACY